MKIETKFNVGDTFVAIKDGKATEMVVNSLFVHVYRDSVNITYTPQGSYTVSFKESECFKSKEELIASL